MENKNKLPAVFASIHTRLIGLPLILFIGALVLDIACSVSQNHTLAGISSVLVALGIPLGILDFVFGHLHRLALPSKSRARRRTWLYETLNLVLVLLFIVSWVFRSVGDGLLSFPFTVTLSFLLTLSFVGILLGVLTLWLGEEIVYGPDGMETGRNSSSVPSGAQAGESRKTIPLTHTGRYGHRSA